MMKTFLPILFVVAVLLAACASQPAATPVTEASQPTVEVVQPTVAPSDVPVLEPTQVPASAASDPLTLQIVPSESTVQYEVGETFFNQNNRFNLAVGVTPQVSGEVHLDPANPQNSTIGPVTVDISQFTSDSGQRDRAIRGRFLESSRFPTATFTSTSVDGLPETYTPGQPISFTVTGDLTVREVTQPVTFDVIAVYDQAALTGTATTTLSLTDFGISIEIAGILKTEDEAKLTMNFVAR